MTYFMFVLLNSIETTLPLMKKSLSRWFQIHYDTSHTTALLDKYIFHSHIYGYKNRSNNKFLHSYIYQYYVKSILISIDFFYQQTAQNSSDWSQKLQHEDQDEHYERFGKFDVWEDTGYKNKFNETENEWADRIYAEFSRLQSRNNKLIKSKKDAMEEKEERDPKKAPKKKELLLKIPKKNPEAKQTLFRDKLSKLLDPQNTELITTNSLLPFDENSTSDYIINQLLLSDGSDSTTATGSQVQDQKRKRIKEVIRIWHPDKFSQLYHQRIDPEHRDDIIRIVTHISQALLNFGRQ